MIVNMSLLQTVDYESGRANSSAQFSCSVMSDSLWPHGLQHGVACWWHKVMASLFITNSQSLLKLMSIESVMPFNHLFLCHPSFLLPLIFPSFRVFSNESALPIRWPKYWSFSFSISPSNEYSGLIAFRMDWLDLLAEKTLKSLLQQHNSKASILWRPGFFIVQCSHPYMTTGKTIALTRRQVNKETRTLKEEKETDIFFSTLLCVSHIRYFFLKLRVVMTTIYFT